MISLCEEHADGDVSEIVGNILECLVVSGGLPAQ